MEYRATSHHTAAEVYATMVDKDYLTARLEQMGGKDARLMEHRADAEGARYSLRHGLDARELPPAVAALLPGNLVIERVESLRRVAEGQYSGDVTVTIRGTPASAAGWMRLTDRAPSGSELHIYADVVVQIPFFGGKIEAVIAEQITTLLGAETRFTLDWLARAR